MVFSNIFASFVILFIAIFADSSYQFKVESIPIQEIPYLRYTILTELSCIERTLYLQWKIREHINNLKLEFDKISSAYGIDEVLESPFVVNGPLENDAVPIGETLELSTLETLPSEEDELSRSGNAPIFTLIKNVFSLLVAIVYQIFQIFFALFGCLKKPR